MPILQQEKHQSKVPLMSNLFYYMINHWRW